MLTSDILSKEQKEKLKAEIESDFIRKLSDAAEAIPHNEAIPVALDWINGRRTPDANQELEAAVTNLNMGTRAPHIFKALVNAICFGSKKILDRFEDEGIEIKSVVGIGGVARKSKFIMQSLANTLNVPIKVAASDQAPALGAAVYAAVAAGIYPDVIEASKTLGSDYEAEYHPQPEHLEEFAGLMERYEVLSQFVEKNISKSKKNIEAHV